MEPGADAGAMKGLSRHCKAVNEEERCSGKALDTRQEQQLLVRLRLTRAAPEQVGDGLSHSCSYILTFHRQAAFSAAATANTEDITDITQQLIELESDFWRGFIKIR